MIRFFLSIFLSIWAATAGAQDAATIAPIETTFHGWADGLGADKGTLAITYKGRVVHEAGRGMRAAAPVEIASLSKAITAVCVDKAVRAGKLSYDAQIGPLLGGRIRFAEQRTKAITVAQLLTHSAGLGPDRTQRTMKTWFRATQPMHWQAAQDALGRGRQTKRVGRVSYNNENYAILGAVIEAATQQSYQSYCAPKGARPSLLSKGYLPWGGWQMSAADYARFFGQAYRSGSLGKRPADYPNARYLKEVRYGMGVFYRPFGDGHNFWHVGTFCMAGQLRGAAWAVQWQNGWGVTLSVNRCPRPASFARLDAAMVRAVFR